MKQEKSCGCIVMNEKNKILLVHHNAGHWDFPKGHVEEGETEEQTAIRETKEETNLEVQINSKYRYTTEYSPKEGIWKEVVFFLAYNKTEDIKPQLTEVEELGWFSLEEALEKITYNNSKVILEQLRKDLKEDKQC